MRERSGGLLVGLVLGALGAATACDRGRALADPDGETLARWSSYLEDGDVAAVAPGAMPVRPPMSPPPPSRNCVGSDCASQPLALWTFDDCNTQSSELADSASSTFIRHPAFRSLGVACVAGRDGQAVHLAKGDDVVYAPDQPDFAFDQGLTVAAWINPDRLAGTQSLVRKRLEGTSSFLLALDGKQLLFVLKLTNGRVIGTAAPVQAGRFTHVAATYDGTQAVLYLDGVKVASARGTGTIAPGAGPIFLGNDADGRRFAGTLDSVWLNTLAAPADTIPGMACVRHPPTVALTPGMSAVTPAGTPAAFDLAITNNNDAICAGAETFQFFGSLSFGLDSDVRFGQLSVATGATAHQAINITASSILAAGPYPFAYIVFDNDQPGFQAFATATMVVAPPPPPMATGCAPSPTQPVAPGGYYVNGNTVCTSDGRTHVFHGVDRPSLEWSNVGVNITRGDFALMTSWNANVVRIALNQDFWLPGSALFDPHYPALVDDAITWAEMAGMDVFLDLHWSDRGVLGSCPPSAGCQQLMADTNSLTFWSQVGARYQNDGRVAFELYNEPHDVGWDVWRNGGTTFQGWQAVGMQQLYDAVRATGAQNLVVIGGLDWAYDLSGVPANRVNGYNIVYATHPYTSTDRSLRPPSDWDRAFGSLTRTDPVVATEFGVLNDTACTTDYDSQLIQYADAHLAGWTAWAWYPGGCTFPAIVNDWAGTPSATGSVVRAALLGYHDAPASPPLPSPAPPRAVEFLFDHSTQGWGFNAFNSPPPSNIFVQPGGAPPSISLDSSDGNPAPGALRVTAPFTALDQFVDAIVGVSQPGLNLSGQQLHVMVKLVSGTFGGLQFHASSGASFAFTAAPFVGSLPLGQWVPITLDLTSGTSPDFDPSQVVQIGVQFFSGFSNNGGTFVNTGDTVVEIDTLTN
jgi:hypothetical protein